MGPPDGGRHWYCLALNAERPSWATLLYKVLATESVRPATRGLRRVPPIPREDLAELPEEVFHPLRFGGQDDALLAKCAKSKATPKTVALSCDRWFAFGSTSTPMASHNKRQDSSPRALPNRPARRRKSLVEQIDEASPADLGDEVGESVEIGRRVPCPKRLPIQLVVADIVAALFVPRCTHATLQSAPGDKPISSGWSRCALVSDGADHDIFLFSVALKGVLAYPATRCSTARTVSVVS